MQIRPEELAAERARVVEIDEHSLDKECIDLPRQYLRFASIAADAKATVAAYEARASAIAAEVASDIRTNPELYNLDKVTESIIAAETVKHARVQKAKEKVRLAQYENDLAQAVVWALEHKKRSLTLLVELHGRSYFASPPVSAKGRASVMEERRTRRNAE